MKAGGRLGADVTRVVTGYYLATPLFAVADLAVGVPVRVGEILPPGVRYAYYAALFALGLLCRARPGATPWVGMAESSTNLLILFLSILVPIWSVGDAWMAGAPAHVGLTPATGANALLAGGAMILSFRKNQEAALGRRGSGEGRSIGWRLR